ncbi:hypothetical protein OUZ56_032640, partial [Daphnia magna]
PMSATDNLDEVLKELGELLRKKNAAYGDSFANVPKILAIMFPQIPEPTLRLVLLFARYLDKMARRAADPGAFGEDTVLDFAGYSVLDLCLVWAAKQEKVTEKKQDEAPGIVPATQWVIKRGQFYLCKLDDSHRFEWSASEGFAVHFRSHSEAEFVLGHVAEEER